MESSQIDFNLKLFERTSLRVVDRGGLEVPLESIRSMVDQVLIKLSAESSMTDEILFCHAFTRDGTSLSVINIFIGMLLAAFLQTEGLSIEVERRPFVDTDFLELEKRLMKSCLSFREKQAAQYEDFKSSLFKSLKEAEIKFKEKNEAPDLCGPVSNISAGDSDQSS